MEVTYEFNMNPKTKQGLKNISDDILFAIASQTLDISISKEIIPIGKTHHLLESSKEFGVHRNHNDMTIGSSTDYATYVWNLPQKTTNWTNEGKAHSQWYAYTLKAYGQVIINNAIEQAWKENM